MSVRLGKNRYGKSRVRLVWVDRGETRHDVVEVTVAISVAGDFERAHTEGDNSQVLPTDTMKNTVYALAQQGGVGTIEAFGWRLADHFLSNNPQMSDVRVELLEDRWQRIAVVGREAAHHPWSFVRGGGERRVAVIEATAEGSTLEGGIDDLLVLKTTASEFHGYPKDQFTTLPETRDRIFSTSLSARWTFRSEPNDFDALWNGVRQAILDVFAQQHSLSVQQTAYDMGAEVLKRFPEIEGIQLVLPNKHCIPVNMEPLGLTGTNEVFVATDEPHGLIQVAVERTA
jgi:urate oxidase